MRIAHGQDAYGASACSGQRPGGAVASVAQLLDHLLDPFPSRGFHPFGAVQDPGNRLMGDSRPGRDIGHGRRTPASGVDGGRCGNHPTIITEDLRRASIPCLSLNRVLAFEGRLRPCCACETRHVDLQILYTILAGLLLVVSALGTIFPILPGSLLAIGTLLAWGWLLGSGASWWAAGLGIAIAFLGWSASAVLTGRKLKQHAIPKGSILTALIGAIAGAFLIPVVGLFVGFAVGLFTGEALRRGETSGALASSWAALKAMGLGIVIELGCVLLASSVWMIGVITHFATR